MKRVAWIGFIISGLTLADSLTQAPFRKAGLPPAIARIAAATGDRFFVAGKERMQGTAEVRLNGTSSRTVQFLLEFPGRLRLEGEGVSVTERPDRQRKSDTPEDVQLLADTLLTDSVDGFLAAQVLGGSSRHNGARFVESATGRRYDIFTAYVPAQTTAGPRNRARQFWFDDSTGLLTRVIAGSQGSDVVYSEWRLVAGNWVPGRIARRVGGATVLEIVLHIAGFSERRQDSVFE